MRIFNAYPNINTKYNIANFNAVYFLFLATLTVLKTVVKTEANIRIPIIRTNQSGNGIIKRHNISPIMVMRDTIMLEIGSHH